MSTCQNSVDKLCSDAFSVHTENTCKTENRIGIVCEHFQVTFRTLNSEHLKKNGKISVHTFACGFDGLCVNDNEVARQFLSGERRFEVGNTAPNYCRLNVIQSEHIVRIVFHIVKLHRFNIIVWCLFLDVSVYFSVNNFRSLCDKSILIFPPIYWFILLWCNCCENQPKFYLEKITNTTETSEKAKQLSGENLFK